MTQNSCKCPFVNFAVVHDDECPHRPPPVKSLWGIPRETTSDEYLISKVREGKKKKASVGSMPDIDKDDENLHRGIPPWAGGSAPDDENDPDDWYWHDKTETDDDHY